MRRPTILEFCQVFKEKLDKFPELNNPEWTRSEGLDFIHTEDLDTGHTMEVYPTMDEYRLILPILDILMKNPNGYLRIPHYEDQDGEEPARVDHKYPGITPDISL